MKIIKLKKLNPNAKTPTKGSSFSAGFDLYACLEHEIKIKPNETIKVPTGIALEIPTGFVGLIFARSGLATKKGLAPANKVGVCDSDYRGEYLVALHNHGQLEATIKPNDRIAQLVVVEVQNFDFEEVAELSSTQRNENGFGSTGN